MKTKNVSDKELDNLLDRLSESVHGPKGKYTAGDSYLQLQARLPLKSRKSVPLFKYVAAASVAIILVFSTYLLFNYSGSTEIILVTTDGNTKEVVLPDGSHVILNHYSSLQYPTVFNRKAREVILSGEAYFEVASKKKHPFIAHSEHTHVTVLGTRFNLQSYPNDACIKTTLIEGKVTVSAFRDNKTIILNPNETAFFDKRTGVLIKKINENAMDEISWKEGKHIFDNKPLLEITTDLSNYFNVRIVMDCTHLQIYRMTAWFEQNESIEEILNILQTGANFNWKKENNIIIITPN